MSGTRMTVASHKDHVRAAFDTRLTFIPTFGSFQQRKDLNSSGVAVLFLRVHNDKYRFTLVVARDCD
ncbi:hypothetical protein TNCV_4070771 [Trichonephila clavipes]|nr:hypothetical protein TNCV_4070771 [Trichonephila clavipes]